MGKIVGQAEVFNLGIAASPGQENILAVLKRFGTCIHTPERMESRTDKEEWR